MLRKDHKINQKKTLQYKKILYPKHITEKMTANNLNIGAILFLHNLDLNPVHCGAD